MMYFAISFANFYPSLIGHYDCKKCGISFYGSGSKRNLSRHVKKCKSIKKDYESEEEFEEISNATEMNNLIASNGKIS